MKGMFKRALAGVAAAALAATGLMLGAGAANAAPNGDQSITIVNSQTGHTYTAYQIASFENIVDTDSDGHIDQVDVVTVTDSAAAAAVAAAAGTVPAPYMDNPAAYVATFTAAQLRDFADAFNATGLTPSGTATGTDNANAVIEDITPGWYVVTDFDGKVMVVTSTIDNYQTMTINGIEQTLGEIVAKSVTPIMPGKTADETTEALGVGSTVHFTVTWNVPNVAGLDPDTVTYVLRDQPGLGLTVKRNDVKVYVADENGTIDSTAAGFDWLPAGVKVAEITLDASKFTGFTDGSMDGNGQNLFTVDLSDWIKNTGNAKYAGAALYLRYSATINTQVQESETVENKADVTTKSDDPFSGTPAEVTVKVGRLEFLKYGVDGDSTSLSGASFKVTDSEGNVLEFSKTTNGYVLDPTGGLDVVTSDNKGMVKIFGLPEDEYTFEETGFADGYSDQFTPKFVINVSLTDGNVNYELLQKENQLGMAGTGTVEGYAGIAVKNVKNITQLPMTGAAGTALFTVLGLLIAGAGALVYMKSRNVKHALRG